MTAEELNVERSHFVLCCSRQQTEEAVAKASRLKEELVNTKESLKKTVLDLEMLSHEKDEISETDRTIYCSILKKKEQKALSSQSLLPFSILSLGI